MSTPSLSVTSETSSSHASPQMESCCYRVVSVGPDVAPGWHELTATSMRSLDTSSMLRITFFSIFTSCESFFARSGPNAPADLWRKVWPEVPLISPVIKSSCPDTQRTNVGLAKEAPALCRGRRRRGVLNLRRLCGGQCAVPRHVVDLCCLPWAREIGAYCMCDAWWADVAGGGGIKDVWFATSDL
jgi:hypothetical protein